MVTGRYDFAEDHPMPGKLYARILGSPYAHARILSIDTSKAEALEGVKAAITHEDNSLWDDEVKCVGYPVAAVAAVDEVTAERALDLIEVNYEVLPFVVDPEEAMQPGAPLTGAFPDSNMGSSPSGIERGDIEQGFIDADVIVEETTEWSTGYTHQDLEPDSATAWWEGDDIHCYVASQGPFQRMSSLTRALDLPRNRVHVTVHGTGGGFGGKGGTSQDVICALLSKKTGKPVASRLNRMIYTANRGKMYGVKATMKMGAKSDGTLTAVDMTFWTDGGRTAGGQPGSLGYVGQHTWKCPNFKFEHWRVATNTPSSGAWRGVAYNPAQFISDFIVEKMAAQLGMSPLEFRRKIFVTEDMVDQDNDRPLDMFGLHTCLDYAADAIGYTTKYHAPGTQTLPDGRLHGIGIGGQLSGLGGILATSGAVINMWSDGTVRYNAGSSRCQGRHIYIAAVIAETLGVTLEQVREADFGSTDDAAEDSGQFASRSATNLGGAFKNAAEDVRAQLFAKAAAELEVAPEDLDAKGGEIFSKTDPTKRLNHEDVLGGFGAQPVIGRGVRMSGLLRRPVGTFPIGSRTQHNTAIVSAAEVAVDPETGEVELLSLANAVDAGRALDPVCCDGQAKAALVLLYDQAVLLDEIYDPGTGYRLNSGFLNDRLATTLDVPEDKNYILVYESIGSIGPYGAAGIGEPGSTCAYSSINNAINNAIGSTITSRPFTPEKILQALGKV
jgi:CO/xanthine dehydrogenase Mo-binding subunit